MKKYFYSHLVKIELLEMQLDTLSLSPVEREDLVGLAHQNIHNAVMDEILSSLEPEDKKKFLELYTQGEHDKIWSHLNEKIEKIEDRIKIVSSQIKAELTRDIEKLKSE